MKAYAILILALFTLSVSAQSVIEQMINLTNPASLNAVNTVYGTNLKISIVATVIWGTNIDVFTFDQANYDKFIAREEWDNTALNCNYTTFVNASNDRRIDFIANASKSDCQGFTAEEIDVGKGPIYVTMGYRDKWCKCPSCFAGCAGTSPASYCSKAFVNLRVDVKPVMDDRMRNLIAIGAVLILLCGGLGACQFVYNHRQKARERAQREAEQFGEDGLSGGQSIALTEFDTGAERRAKGGMNRL